MDLAAGDPRGLRPIAVHQLGWKYFNTVNNVAAGTGALVHTGYTLAYQIMSEFICKFS